MNFQISSEELANPQLVDVLRKVYYCFSELGQDFFVIGATARDIMVRLLIGIVPSRRTRDLDLAIAIPAWDTFDRVRDTLLAHGFTKDPKMHQRFKDGNNYELDILPYGDVAKEDGYIYWPPEEDIAMSVNAFAEILSDAITVCINEEFCIRVASLYGLFVLKFNAWLDRHTSTDKDAEDIEFIIRNYFAANVARLPYQHSPYHEVYTWEDFNEWVAGAYWLAHDIAQILSSEQLCFYSAHLKYELELADRSCFIQQILAHNKALGFELVIGGLSKMLNVLENNRSKNDI